MYAFLIPSAVATVAPTATTPDIGSFLLIMVEVDTGEIDQWRSCINLYSGTNVEAFVAEIDGNVRWKTRTFSRHLWLITKTPRTQVLTKDEVFQCRYRLLARVDTSRLSAKMMPSPIATVLILISPELVPAFVTEIPNVVPSLAFKRHDAASTKGSSWAVDPRRTQRLRGLQPLSSSRETPSWRYQLDELFKSASPWGSASQAEILAVDLLKVRRP